MDTPLPGATPRLRHRDHFCLSFYWFAVNVHWGAIMAVLVQSQVMVLVGDEMKGRAAGLVIGIGSITGIVLPPILGAVSDRVRSRAGRRRPFMVAGTLINVVALAGLAHFPFVGATGGGGGGFPVAFALYVGAYLVANLGNQVAAAPYAGLMPDRVPPAERGIASGWIGLMTTLGSGVGIALAGGIVNYAAPRDEFRHQCYLAYGLIAATLIGALAVTCLGVRETPALAPPKPLRWRELTRGLFGPFRSSDFLWVVVSRLFVTMGFFTVLNFLQFYMADAVRTFTAFGRTLATTAEGAVSYALVVMLAAATVSAIVGGRWSDRIGRKLLVYASGGGMAAVALGVILFPSYPALLAIAALFGISYGAYQSVDWALATDVLPRLDDAAKDMGLWHVALTLPQLVATPLAGLLLDTFQGVGRSSGRPTLGYTVIFLVAVAYFAVGTILVRRVRGAR